MSVKKEVSIIEFRDNENFENKNSQRELCIKKRAKFPNSKRFKVTRHIPDFSVSETKLFDSKEEALKQFNEWLE